MESINNISLKFSPDKFDITEGKDGGWLRIGGLALEEGVSRNKNRYTFKNLQENNSRNFKWVFGHPAHGEVEEHIVGMGQLSLSDTKLMHEGRIRNTARHPDIIESVRDGFLGPSIHATAKKITKEKDEYLVEGLEIDGIGLVAFQGVKNASIDYAIAESFELENKTNEGEKTMEEEKPIKEEEAQAPAEAPEAPEEAPKEEEKEEAPKEEEAKEEPAPAPAEERLKQMQEQIDKLNAEKKENLVESIIKINSELKKEELLKESDDRLGLILGYETKLASKNESAAIVEEKAEEAPMIAEANDGTYSMTKESYEKFNREMREKIR